MKNINSFQIGKNGISENLIESLKSNFKNHQNIKIVFLKNFSRDKEKIKQSTENIVDNLGRNYTYRIIGFTAFIKKWRKPMR
ncbi:MAG TPA: YhbY family RNA-binding protein [Candidatus Nanoarchaeia archaeon]|nr:YhbY family RNA-binding protein [Candidatus Nanoarchaeia archaeon]